MNNLNSKSRRNFINQVLMSGTVIGGLGLFGCQNFTAENNNPVRRFHISLQPEAWIEKPELITILKTAGVTDIWMASFLQGRWYHTAKELREAGAIMPNSRVSKWYCVSCAIHSHTVKIRSADDRKKRDRL